MHTMKESINVQRTNQDIYQVKDEISYNVKVE